MKRSVSNTLLYVGDDMGSLESNSGHGFRHFDGATRKQLCSAPSVLSNTLLRTHRESPRVITFLMSEFFTRWSAGAADPHLLSGLFQQQLDMFRCMSCRCDVF